MDPWIPIKMIVIIRLLPIRSLQQPDLVSLPQDQNESQTNVPMPLKVEVQETVVRQCDFLPSAGRPLWAAFLLQRCGQKVLQGLSNHILLCSVPDFEHSYPFQRTLEKADSVTCLQMYRTEGSAATVIEAPRSIFR